MTTLRRLSLAAALLALASPPAESAGFEEGVGRAMTTLRESFAHSADDLKSSGKSSRKTFVLRVLTFNIQGLPFGDRHHQFAAIGKILAVQRNQGTAPHIVAIQEAFHPSTDDLVEESGYPYYRYGAPGTSGRPLKSGLITLSEFPIEGGATIDFEKCSGWDCWANKGVLHTRIGVPGLPTPLDFFNTHMNASDDDLAPEGDNAMAVRIDQIRQIKDFLAFRTAENAPVIFSSDFNFRPSGADYAAFANIPDMRNAVEDCFLSRSCTGEKDPERVWRRHVDHHFFTGAPGSGIGSLPAHVEQTFKEPLPDGKLPSDHFGLEVHFHLSWPSAQSVPLALRGQKF